MNGSSDFLPRRVRNSLHENDNNLRLAGVSLLELELTEALCRRDTHTLLPKDLLRIAVQFYRKLNVAAARVAKVPSSLDLRHPAGPFRFKQTNDLVVAFQDSGPVLVLGTLGTRMESQQFERADKPSRPGSAMGRGMAGRSTSLPSTGWQRPQRAYARRLCGCSLVF